MAQHLRAQAAPAKDYVRVQHSRLLCQAQNPSWNVTTMDTLTATFQRYFICLPKNRLLKSRLVNSVLACVCEPQNGPGKHETELDCP